MTPKTMERPSRSTRNLGYQAVLNDFEDLTDDEIREAAIERARRAGHQRFGEVTWMIHELSYVPAGAIGGRDTGGRFRPTKPDGRPEQLDLPMLEAPRINPERFHQRLLVATVEVIV